MKIKHTDKSKTLTFHNLSLGDVFEYGDVMFMKIKSLSSDEPLKMNVEAINLSSAQCTIFNLSAIVRRYPYAFLVTGNCEK